MARVSRARVMLWGSSTRAPGAAVQGRPRGAARVSAPSPRPRLGRGPARTHLASSSSGVSGHFAAKWAVTALDAEAVPGRSSESHSTVWPRSSSTTLAASAMTRSGKREPPGAGAYSPQPPRHRRLLPTRRRPLPVGGARVRYSGPGREGAGRMRVQLRRRNVPRELTPPRPEPRRCGRCRDGEPRGWCYDGRGEAVGLGTDRAPGDRIGLCPGWLGGTKIWKQRLESEWRVSTLNTCGK